MSNPSVSICLTNYQSGDAIKLAIESIRRHTTRAHNIIVYDDASDPIHYGDELAYLRTAHANGWITLIEGKERVGHNLALPRLLAAVTDDLAMVLDCDIQILRPGWLDEMVEAQARTNAALIVDIESAPDNPVILDTWFFMLDMRQYREFEATWNYTKRPDFISWTETPDNLYATGYRVWERANAQGRAIIPVPPSVRNKWRHFAHISVLSWPPTGKEYAVRQARMALIKAELDRLRRG